MLGHEGTESYAPSEDKTEMFLDAMSAFLKDMVGVGILIPDEDLEDYVREIAKLPGRSVFESPPNRDERREAQRRAPEAAAGAYGSGSHPEVDPEENQEAIDEAKKRLGR